MARAYGTGRTKQILLRVSPEEKQLIDQRAQAASLSTNEYVRTRALADLDSPQATRAVTIFTNQLSGLSQALTEAQRVLGGEEASDGDGN